MTKHSQVTSATRIVPFVYTEGVVVPQDVDHVTVDPSVTIISQYAFHDRRNLTSITFPASSSLVTIQPSAFRECTNLSTLSLPDSLSTIGTAAFYMCTSLLSLHIPDSVSSIGETAFYECTSLTSVHLPGPNLFIINSNVFGMCTSLRSVHLPESLTTIGDGAFSWCTSLPSIRLPDSLSTIASNAFHRCTSLTCVDLPDSISTIGLAAFYRCTSLHSVRLPESLSSISLDTFQGCYALTTIHAPSSFTETTGTITNEINNWRKTLRAEQFYPIQLSHVLAGQLKSFQQCVYYDWKTLAKKPYGSSGRTPLCLAAENSVKWSGKTGWLRNIFVAYMPAIEVCDGATGLWSFMLAAVGQKSDLETVYELLREYPAALHSLN